MVNSATRNASPDDHSENLVVAWRVCVCWELCCCIESFAFPHRNTPASVERERERYGATRLLETLSGSCFRRKNWAALNSFEQFRLLFDVGDDGYNKNSNNKRIVNGKSVPTDPTLQQMPSPYGAHFPERKTTPRPHTATPNVTSSFPLASDLSLEIRSVRWCRQNKDPQ